MEARRDWRPEGWLGVGRGSHAWRDPWGLEGSGGAQLVFPLPTWALGSRLGSWAGFSTLQAPLGCIGPRGMEWGEEEEMQTGRGPLGSEDQGGMCLAFPLPTRPWEACLAPGPGPPPSRAPSSHVGPRGMGGREERGRGGEADGGGGGPSGTGGSGEARPAIPAPSRVPGSLMGSWAGSFTLQGPLQPRGS